MRQAILLSLLAFGLFPAAASAPATEAGQVRYVKITSPAFDRFTDAPTAGQARLMRQRFWRIVGYAPYFDARTAWHPGALVYKDLYAIHVGSRRAARHPRWLLRDRSGRRLYIPWACNGRRCPQYAADITEPRVPARVDRGRPPPSGPRLSRPLHRRRQPALRRLQRPRQPCGRGRPAHRRTHDRDRVASADGRLPRADPACRCPARRSTTTRSGSRAARTAPRPGRIRPSGRRSSPPTTSTSSAGSSTAG